MSRELLSDKGVGGRYGSVEQTTGKSYTQLEYEYALSLKMPLFACVVNEDALDERVRQFGRRVIENSNQNGLKDFRALVLSKLVKFWNDKKDIKIAVGETLSHFSRREELIGWVRASQQADTVSLADEITRLSKENFHLRQKISDQIEPTRINGLSYKEINKILDSKGFLEWIKENREIFFNDFVSADSTTEGAMNEMRRLGFMFYDSRLGIYSLTDAGRAFFNVMEMERRAQKSSATPDRVECCDGKTLRTIKT